ncbi:MAG TPA: PLP-dependent aminotransferase family protein [candidate division Zixibacteria bacterium]|nr:PLP-dependent aminotransferase family protein [candidate division Zixibacteria bacterium]HPI32096.1 PLP-dependent aminotransferase family protein [candidate division Zixibacteria bacterium]HQL23932.1 PLP-dependent aminotransferase family protein [candidate division Zixibacteria bacterium]
MTTRLRRSEIRELLKLTRTPGTISFGGGLPDPVVFPREAVEAASKRAIRERGDLALQYSPTEGEPFLKEQLAAYMQRHDEIARPEDMLVVSSSQQALDLLGRIFIDPGDPVLIERPTYVGSIQAWRALDADFQGVDMDDDGIIPEKLDAKIRELVDGGRPPKFIYVIPDFQNPSGINLSLERRHEVLAIASRYDLPIIEDSPYRELRFSGELIPSMYSLDTERRVILMKTLSKIYTPGFRLGWIVAPPDVLDKLIMVKQGADLCTSAYVSIITGYLFEDGAIERQVERCRDLYARKADVMLAAMEREMPKIPGLWWSKPTGGMFLWLRMPNHMDTMEMIHDAINLKVAYVVGTAFYTDGSGRNEMRLNYSYPTEEQIELGVERLGKLIRMRVRGEKRAGKTPADDTDEEECAACADTGDRTSEQDR